MPPGMVPPGVTAAQQPKKINPTAKKKKLLYILTGIFVLSALATIVTAIYFYLNYVKK
jgi:flagellar basal body-associated protein FliL